jgi:transposase
MSAEEPVAKGPYRRHSTEFKLHVSSEIRSGQLGRREAQKKYKLSDNLIQQWLARYDLQTLQGRVVKADSLDACQARVAALERKIGQLTMALDGLDRRRSAARSDRARAELAKQDRDILPDATSS